MTAKAKSIKLKEPPHDNIWEFWNMDDPTAIHTATHTPSIHPQTDRKSNFSSFVSRKRSMSAQASFPVSLRTNPLYHIHSNDELVSPRLNGLKLNEFSNETQKNNYYHNDSVNTSFKSSNSSFYSIDESESKSTNSSVWTSHDEPHSYKSLNPHFWSTSQFNYEETTTKNVGTQEDGESWLSLLVEDLAVVDDKTFNFDVIHESKINSPPTSVCPTTDGKNTPTTQLITDEIPYSYQPNFHPTNYQPISYNPNSYTSNENVLNSCLVDPKYKLSSQLNNNNHVFFYETLYPRQNFETIEPCSITTKYAPYGIKNRYITDSIHQSNHQSNLYPTHIFDSQDKETNIQSYYKHPLEKREKSSQTEHKSTPQFDVSKHIRQNETTGISPLSIDGGYAATCSRGTCNTTIRYIPSREMSHSSIQRFQKALAMVVSNGAARRRKFSVCIESNRSKSAPISPKRSIKIEWVPFNYNQMI